jgi:hypothetical protein
MGLEAISFLPIVFNDFFDGVKGMFWLVVEVSSYTRSD